MRIMLVWIVAFLVHAYVPLCPIILGSLDAVSTHGPITFPTSDNNNIIQGASVLEAGFSLQDYLTTCSFNGFLPVLSFIQLSGGQLHLLQDLTLGNTAAIVDGGRIYGKNHALTLPTQALTFYLPKGEVENSLKLAFIDKEAMFSRVRSVSWSVGSEYLAGGSYETSSNNELKIYYFDGNVLTTTQSIEIDTNVYSIAWHPDHLYLAVGVRSSSGRELRIFRLNVSNGTFSVTDDRDHGSRRVYAVEWHPSGNYLLIGKRGGGSNELIMYSFNSSNGLLTDLTAADLSPSRDVSVNAISFSPDGSHVVVGTERESSSGGNELIVYNFNGSTLTESATQNPNTNVLSVAWNPVYDEYIAAGYNDGSQRLRLFKYDSVGESLTDLSSAYVGEDNAVESVHWHPSGQYLAVGTDDGISSRLDIYYFNNIAETLTLLQSITPVTAVYAARWAPIGDYIAWGENGRDVSVAGPVENNSDLLFNQTKLIQNSPVSLERATFIERSCVIDGQGHLLSFGDEGSLLVKPFSSLRIENAYITNLKNNKLVCLDGSANITLVNCIVNLDQDFTFSQGSLFFSDDVTIGGTNRFIYSSRGTMSVDARSTVVFHNGLTFSYDPLTPHNNLLYFSDSSSRFLFDGATLHATHTGLILSNGTILIDNAVTFSSEGRNTGEGIIIDPSLTLAILGAGELSLEGNIVY